MKKSKNTLFVIPNADVFKSPGGDLYIVFGEAKVEDLQQKAAALAAQHASQARVEASRKVPQAAAPTVVDEEVIDESGIDPKDIDLVVSQAGSSRAAAVKALKNNDNDIVNAIMELTM